jgi:hypothetical protein
MKTIEKILKAMNIPKIEEDPYQEKYYNALNLKSIGKDTEFSKKDFYITLINIKCAQEEAKANEERHKEKGRIEESKPTYTGNNISSTSSILNYWYERHPTADERIKSNGLWNMPYDI